MLLEKSLTLKLSMESGHNMSYLYKINIVVDENEDNVQIQNTIDDMVQRSILKLPFAEIVSQQIVTLNNDICGKCSSCGAWTSDRNSNEYIDEFSDGCLIDGKWLCDLCLPSYHPKSF